MTSILNKWTDGLAKTSQATFNQIRHLLKSSEITETTFEILEELLIQGDVGIKTSQDIINELKNRQKALKIKTNSEIQLELRNILFERIDSAISLNINHKPFVILIVGVNGSGKTTSIAKLCFFFQQQGKSLLLGAADTYRAAGIDQIQVWADRLDIPIIVGQPGGDAGAVVFDTIQSAIARKSEIVIIDTAGRLHTKYNLMEEIKKVHKVASKSLVDAPHAIWLVIDATTGQNALQQSKAFKEAVQVNGIILAKLDSSAKGGMVFSIKEELGIPILFAGLGEKLEDLEIFYPEAFINGILGDNKTLTDS